MKKFFFVLVAATGFSALPPLAQSTREIQALLTDTQFYESLGSSELIKDIIRNDRGYLIITQNYAMQVDVQYGGGEVKMVGPAKFSLEFHQPIDVRTGLPKV